MSAGIIRRNLVVGALAGFGELLRRFEVEVDASRLQTALGALGVVDPADRLSVYWALRCSLISRSEQIEAFDAAFDAFWSGTSLDELPAPAPAKDAGAEAGVSKGLVAESAQQSFDPADNEEPGEGEELAVGFSAVERLRTMDFRDYGPDELAAARRLLQRLAPALPQRRSRRMRPAARGALLDRHATLRSAMRSDGHPIQLRWRDRDLASRRLLFLVDVSGSMEPYARPVLIFLQAACQASGRVEAFSFGTRLTRLTRELANRNPSRALERAAGKVPDWAGGTRIGDAMKEFNRRWGHRGLTRGSVVVVVSDGWERGDVSTLAEGMKQLQRAAHTVVWVNPLLADPDYEPLVAGMAAALPSVDIFLPGHNLGSLEDLAAVLASLPEGRRGRRAGSGRRLWSGAPTARGATAEDGGHRAEGPHY